MQGAPSRLGTKSYWDAFYARERENFVSSDGADKGVDWFSENISDRLMRWLCEDNVLELGETVDVLDLGSGNGTFLFELEERRPWDGALVGVDYSEEAVDFARKIAARSGSRVNFQVGNVAALVVDTTFALVHDKGASSSFSSPTTPAKAPSTPSCSRRWPQSRPTPSPSSGCSGLEATSSLPPATTRFLSSRRTSPLSWTSRTTSRTPRWPLAGRRVPRSPPSPSAVGPWGSENDISASRGYQRGSEFDSVLGALRVGQ